MIFLWNIKSIIVGILFGVGLGGGFFLIAEQFIADIRLDDPNDEFINSEPFMLLMKYGAPLFILISSAILIGPLFAWINEQFILRDFIFGVNSGLAFILSVLLFSLFLDLAVLVTRTPFPIFKLLANTWMFIIFGVLLHFL